MKTILMQSIVLLAFLPLFAQQGDTLFIQRGEEGRIRFARFVIDEQSDRKMQNDTVFLKSVLQAKPEDEFHLKSVNTDELGITHKRFRQYYKGIKVENAEYLLHGKDNHIEYINGNFADISLQSVEPILNEQQALSKALEYVGAEKYKHEDLVMETFIKQHKNDPDATYYPKGELVIAKDYLNKSGLFHLSWKFTVSSLQPDNAQIIIVDAINGKINQDVPLIFNSNISGIAQTLYSGVKNVTCDSLPNAYRLCESRTTTQGNSVPIHTKNCLNGTDYANAIDFLNTGADWTSENWAAFNQDQLALDAHWGSEKVLDYWSSVHNRNSLNDSGLHITNYVHYNSEWVNAQWDGELLVMRYGDGNDTITPFTALDVVTHEMGTRYRAVYG